MNLLGAVIYLRMGWMTAQAGIRKIFKVGIFKINLNFINFSFGGRSDHNWTYYFVNNMSFNDCNMHKWSGWFWRILLYDIQKSWTRNRNNVWDHLFHHQCHYGGL